MKVANPTADAQPETLRAASGVSIAYHRLGGKSPGVVFLGGFMSDMTGSKAVALEAYCRARGQSFVRFDYSGHGASSGRFEDGAIGLWVDDALTVLDRLTEGPQVLVGSSMGGWISLLTALRRPERVAGFVGVAAAPDFTEDLIWGVMSAADRERMTREGVIYEKSEYGDKAYALTLKLVEDGRNHLLLRGPIPLACPVRLLHGMNDPDVPWRRSPQLAEQITGADVRVTLIKEGDHRLSRDSDIAQICAAVEELLSQPDNLSPRTSPLSPRT